MRKATTMLLTAILACSLCACSGKPAQQQNAPATANTPTQQETVATTEQTAEDTEEDGYSKDMFDYHYALPEQTIAEPTNDGALCNMSACELFIYRSDVLEFNTWDDVVEQCKKKVSSAIFSATRFRASEQTAEADSPFTNQYGVEMMRVTGELSGSEGTKPYIAYYYITDENYVRFIIALNYENEADAADAIDFVAERLEKGEN